MRRTADSTSGSTRKHQSEGQGKVVRRVSRWASLRVPVAAAVLAIALTAVSAVVTPATAEAADFNARYRNLSTGLCLDDSNQYGLRSFACNGSSHQLWTVHRFLDNTVSLRNAQTQRCMDYSKTYGMRTYGCNASTHQSWIRNYSRGGVLWTNEAAAQQLGCSTCAVYDLRGPLKHDSITFAAIDPRTIWMNA